MDEKKMQDLAGKVVEIIRSFGGDVAEGESLQKASDELVENVLWSSRNGKWSVSIILFSPQGRRMWICDKLFDTRDDAAIENLLEKAGF